MADLDTSAEVDERPDDAAESDEDILAEARERFEYHESVDSENRKNALDDTEFVWVKGKQWPSNIRSQREADSRPWLEINQLPQFVNQVVNDQRERRPGIKVDPASGDASEIVADIERGMIRGIERNSRAEAAYDSGFENAVTSGRGYWRICSEYENAQTFNQVLRIKRIPDPLSVRMDPDYQEPDASDIKWCFVTELVTRKEFERRWPKCDPLSWDTTTEGYAGWYDRADKVVIADYYRIVSRKRTLVAMSDGTVGWKDGLPATLPDGVEIVREREAEDDVCQWLKIAGGEQILERYDVPSRYIPVVMCIGHETIVDGKRIFQGLIRRARDSQTMYNFWQTAATELIALAPRAPFIMAEGQDEGFEQEWSEANRRNFPVLHYKPVTSGGNLAPAPERQQFAGVPAGIVEQANTCKQDLRATIGIYDPSLGQRSNETSGRAILAREKQGDTGTFHFVDNLSRAIALTGQILVELIPHYYDTQRIVSTIDEEDKHKLVTINEQVHGLDPVGAIVNNDLSVGEYAISVEAGPSYATKQQEAADSMMQFIQAYPPAAQIAGDLIAKNMDWPGAEQIANRLKMLLPPAIQQSEQEGMPAIPPQVAQQMAQMGQQMQGMQQALHEMQAENQQLKSGAAEKLQIAQMENERKVADSRAENERKWLDMQADAELREKQAMLDAETTIREAEIKAKATLEAAAISAKTQLDIANMKVMGAPEDPALVEALMAIVQQASGLSARASATRVARLEFDANGNPTHAVSQYSQPEDTQPQPEMMAGAKPSLGMAILMMAKQMQQLAQLASAPRRHQFITDEQGNPIGTISAPTLQ